MIQIISIISCSLLKAVSLRYPGLPSLASQDVTAMDAPEATSNKRNCQRFMLTSPMFQWVAVKEFG